MSPEESTHNLLLNLPEYLPGLENITETPPDVLPWQAGDILSFVFTFPDKTEVDVELSATPAGDVYLGLLLIRKYLNRGRGYGRAFLNMLCGWADAHEITIELLSAPIKSEMSEEKLREWYEQFGFEQNEKYKVDKNELIRYHKRTVLSVV